MGIMDLVKSVLGAQRSWRVTNAVAPDICVNILDKTPLAACRQAASGLMGEGDDVYGPVTVQETDPTTGDLKGPVYAYRVHVQRPPRRVLSATRVRS
jgi:hypothetical protein